ncbi:MAG: NosD domain-containing protein [Candidatus Hodarchaeota archaeon]
MEVIFIKRRRLTAILLLAAIPFILIVDKSSVNVRTYTGVVENHAPIYIEGNAALATFIAAEGYGDGTSESPYIIEDFIINASKTHGIEIRSTDAYLIIQNCTIEDGKRYGHNGIFLNNTLNINVSNNKVNNNSDGIRLHHSSHSTLAGNMVNNNRDGIRLYNSNHSTLVGNMANNNNRGIYLNASSHITLVGNLANNNTRGIYLNASSHTTLTGNTVNYNLEGISVDESNHTTLSGNTVIYIDQNEFFNNRNGIRLGSSNHTTLAGNIMYGSGLELSYSYNNQIDPSNKVNDKAVRYYENTPGVQLSGESDVGQVILVNCDDSLIERLYISGTSTGITILDSLNSSIAENTIFDCINGIYLRNSSHTLLARNNISYNNWAGIVLGSSNHTILAENTANYNSWGICGFFSSNTTVSGNTANNNEHGILLISWTNNATLIGNTANNNTEGISLYALNHTTLTGNTVNNNVRGIILWYSNHTTLAGNTANNNWDYGIILWNSSHNTLVRNLVSDNNGYGISLNFESSSNIIHHNTFLLNNGGFIQAYDEGDNNRWYDTVTLEGNYWGDYTETGEYVIDGAAGARDPYPVIIDSDNDGMPDMWEYQMDLNLLQDDATGDLDGDGMPNLWEYQMGLQANNPADAALDEDNDGLTNLQEYRLETDPHDSDSDNDFFPDGLDYGWWGNPRKNWDNPLIRVLGSILLINGIGVILWIGYMRRVLPKLHQEIRSLSQDLEQRLVQFQKHLNTAKNPDIPLELLEVEAEQLQHEFHACQETLQEIKLLEKQKWVPSFLCPDLTHLETNFITVQHFFEEFQQMWLKRLAAKY